MQEEQIREEFAEYRLASAQFYQAVFYTVVFLLFDIGSVLVAFYNVDGSFQRSVLAACFFGVFWTSWVLVGIYYAANYFHERLILQSDAVLQHSLFSHKKINIGAIEKIKWQLMSRSGLIKIDASKSKTCIDIGSFSKHDRAEIIDYFRSAVAEELQTGWEESQEKIARIAARPPDFGWAAFARFAVIFFLSAAVASYLWTYDTEMGGVLMAMAVACIAMGFASLAMSIYLLQRSKRKQTM